VRAARGRAQQVRELRRPLRLLVVSAAGNDALDLDHTANLIAVPAQSGSGIAVSATGPMGFALGATNFSRIASYTNFGTSAVNVAAPGGDFALRAKTCAPWPACQRVGDRSCWVFDMVLSTSRGSGASISSYTWAAAPAWPPRRWLPLPDDHPGEPGISLGALKTRIAQSADDEGKVGRDPFYGSGFVNAYKACTAR